MTVVVGGTLPNSIDWCARARTVEQHTMGTPHIVFQSSYIVYKKVSFPIIRQHTHLISRRTVVRYFG